MYIFKAQNVPDQFLQQTRSWNGLGPVHTEVETLPLSAANQALQRLKGAQVRGSVVLTIP